MGQRGPRGNVAVTGVKIQLRMEECAGGMGQRSNDAAAKDVRTKWCVEECAGDMGLRGGGDESTTTP